MTELAVSVRFQAHSSILAGSAPAANYKPTRPLRYTLAQLTQESQCPTKPKPGEEKRFRLGSVSSFPEASSEGRGSNRDGSIRGCNGSEQDAPLCFFCSSLRHGSVFCILKVSSQCCTARLSCAERLSPGFSLVLSDSSLGGGQILQHRGTQCPWESLIIGQRYSINSLSLSLCTWSRLSFSSRSYIKAM